SDCRGDGTAGQRDPGRRGRPRARGPQARAGLDQPGSPDPAATAVRRAARAGQGLAARGGRGVLGDAAGRPEDAGGQRRDGGAAAERAFGQAAAPTSTDQRQTQLGAEIAAIRAREARKLDSLERELANAGEADRLRAAGELLLAYASQVGPGQSSVDLDGQTI